MFPTYNPQRLKFPRVVINPHQENSYQCKVNGAIPIYIGIFTLTEWGRSELTNSSIEPTNRRFAVAERYRDDK